MTTRTILLVDDDADFLQVVGRRCESIGLNVQHARNLLTAAAVVERFIPDLICIDVEMPTGNGLRFCEALADDPHTANVPIIVLTGRADESAQAACERLGAHLLPKTADVWGALEPLIRNILAKLPPRRKRLNDCLRMRNLPSPMIPALPPETDANVHTSIPSQSQPASRQTMRPGPSCRHVIVADDDNDLVESLLERLRQLGCSAVGVHSAAEALQAIRQVQPDLVFLDVKMPSGNGLSVCEAMAADEHLRRIPVIILTGCSDEHTIRRCHDMLVFYVQKGTDVWSRIEPLVFELLHVGAVAEDCPRPIEPPQANPTSQPPSPEPAPQGGENLLDAVFAILGADSGSSAKNATRAPDAMEAVSAPWILCIDDDFDFSDVLKIRFDEYGVAVARAANGMAGFRMAFTTPASAILLDYQMPNGQGDYILGRLKDNPVTCGIPVYIITGVRDRMLERRMMAVGAAGYFNKPINFEALRARLAEHIDALAVSTCSAK